MRRRTSWQNRLLAGQIVLLLVACCCSPPCMADVASISISTRQVVFPMVTVDVLEAGGLEIDPSRQIHALAIEVQPSAEEVGWTLYLHAERAVSAAGCYGRPSGHLSWKFDHEKTSAYRPLADQEWVVFDNPTGGAAEMLIDLRADLDWLTTPGRYRSALYFTVRSR